MLKLRESQFCNLSRAAEWQAWLGEHAPDLLTDLKAFLRSGKGCKVNKEKMLVLREEIYKRNLGEKFEQLIIHRYPLLILREEPPQTCKVQVPKQNVAPVLPIPLASRNPSLNKHGVFKVYRPEMLSFPQKLIIQNKDKGLLQHQVDEFTKSMTGVSTLIIDDTAYIEYLLPKFADVASKLPEKLYETKTWHLAIKS